MDKKEFIKMIAAGILKDPRAPMREKREIAVIVSSMNLEERIHGYILTMTENVDASTNGDRYDELIEYLGLMTTGFDQFIRMQEEKYGRAKLTEDGGEG